MRKQGIKRLALFALAAVCLFALIPIPGKSAGTVQKQTTRAISIAFDNSGSMYGEGAEKPLKRWCQAIYAMEVFAAMLNEGDQLRIYPMNAIEVNGVTYEPNTPLLVRGGVAADIQSIREIYTTTSDWRQMITPIETVIAAMDGLRQMQADEHWLIVLTDGTEFYENGYTLGKKETKSRLSQLLSKYHEEVNVLYLGIFASELDFKFVPDIRQSSMRSMAEPALPEAVPRVLSEMCNYIFQRDELPAGNKTKESLSFDLPMKKLIVLVQGRDVGNVSLEAEGRTVGVDSNIHLQYSEKGCAGKSFDIDRTLQGTLATFTDVPAGSYALKYSGNSSDVSAYYEPDVELAVQLCDVNGDPVQKGQELYRGTYQIRYGLLDSNGDFTDSPLLGNTQYKIEYELNGKLQPSIEGQGTGSFPLELGVGDTVRALHAEVKYLITPSRPEGYFMERNGTELGWPSSGMTIVHHPAGVLTAVPEGGKSDYLLHKMEEQGVYTLRILYDGEPLTGDALDRVQLNAQVDGPGDLRVQVKREDFGYLLYLRHSGAMGDTPEGEYRILLNGSYENDEKTISKLENSIFFTLSSLSHQLGMELERTQSYYVIKELEEGEPLRCELTLDGVPLSEAELQKVRVQAEADGLALQSEPIPGQSAWFIHIGSDPVPEKGKYSIAVFAELNDELGRSVTASDETKVELWPYPQWIYQAIRLGILLLILLFIVGYVPPFKKYLPRKLKSRPTVACQPNRRGVEYMDGTGRYKKNTRSTLVPYKAETGTIRVVPRGVTGVPSMRVKAAGGNAMWLTNVRAFADKENITFNGASVQEDRRKPLSISAGTMINVSTEDFEYICIPNQ